MGIATTPRDSLMLRRLLDNVDAIVGRLDREPAAWRGFLVGGQYVRLACADNLISEDGRAYSVGVHVWSTVTEGHMHDHRWPLAVYVVGHDVHPGALLYRMPWESDTGHGEVEVRSGDAYAIESCRVRHAVHAVRPHTSIAIADITDAPSRDNRLSIEELDASRTNSIRLDAVAALAAGRPR